MDDKCVLDDDALILQKLHDDELYYIFRYLNLIDLLHIEELSPRFEAVAWQVYRTYKKLDYYHEAYEAYNCTITEYEAEQIASRVGPNIEQLRIEPVTKVIPNCLFTHFPKLQRLSIYDCHKSMDKKFIRKMEILIKRLKHFELNSFHLSEQDLMQMIKVSKLESLSVDIPFPEGDFLLKLSGIMELELSRTMPLGREGRERLSLNFRNFCSNNPNLKSLNLIGCGWIDKKCLMSIAKLKNLEVLKISDKLAVDDLEDYLILSTLTKLKYFILYGSEEDYQMTRMYIMLLEGITKHNQLESLRIMHTSKIRFTGRMKAEKRRIIENLTHLKELQIHKLAIWEDEILVELPCHTTLQSARIEDCEASADTVVELIARCPLLKILKLFHCDFHVDGAFIERILPLVKDRNHMLELDVIERDETADSDEDDYDDEDYEEKTRKKLEDLRKLFGNYKGVNSSKLQISSRS